MTAHRTAALSPGGLVRLEERLQLAEPAHVLGRAEPPRSCAEPAEVLRGVAGVRELPVEHGAEPLGADEEVAEPEVAVHRHPLR